MPRKYVWVLTIKDGVERETFLSVYADETLARYHMHRDVIETIAKHNIDDGLQISSKDTELSFAGFSWKIEKCPFVDGIIG